MNITVYCGANAGNLNDYKDAAEAFGNWIANEKHTLVYGGGRIGLMGALADSVIAGGGRVIGVIPEFLSTKEQRHEGVTKMFTVETISERKSMMLELGDAFVALPGGTGTLEEISEAISMCNLKRHDGPCVFLNEAGYYEPLKQMMDNMVKMGFLSAQARENTGFAGNISELTQILSQYHK